MNDLERFLRDRNADADTWVETQAQLDWLETYKDQMSPTQREMLNIE